jgi:SAM-dependent methyltransferase
MASNWLLGLRPETAAGGFSRYDGAIQFFSRVNALLQPSFHVLDLGAGRGAANDDKCTYRRSLRVLRGKVELIIGTDIDDAVLSNPIVDKSFVVAPGAPLPFPDASFDLILSEWVLEHVDDPESFQREVRRLIKPGGWFCARTPNRWGLTALAAQLIPNRLHTTFLKKLQPARQDIDVFPTRYRLNTMRTVGKYFPTQDWENASYTWMGEPKYHAKNVILWRLMALWNWLMPQSWPVHSRPAPLLPVMR